MAVPWLAVGNLVLNNLDKIIGVVRPGFTRKKVEVASAQFDLLNQQIAELQSAASTNAEQIKDLAAQVKEVVGALAQAAANAAAERAADAPSRLRGARGFRARDWLGVWVLVR